MQCKCRSPAHTVPFHLAEVNSEMFRSRDFLAGCVFGPPKNIASDRKIVSLLANEVPSYEFFSGTAEVVDAVGPVLTNVDFSFGTLNSIDNVRSRSPGKPGKFVLRMLAWICPVISITMRRKQMPIPDFQSVMLPLLKSLSNGQQQTVRELTPKLADVFGLTEDERETMIPSGQQKVFHNRVAWAKTYLKAAGLVENPIRGRVRISDAGRSVLRENPESINMKYLERFPGYRAFKDRSLNADSSEGEEVVESQPQQVATPLEQLTQAHQTMKEALREELLSRLLECSPKFFERAVLKLLLAMGYGGVTGDGQVTGQSGDGGIDGIIREDKLGLDVVCLQAKRWENTVGRGLVQQFVGSIDFVRATKGVILTTATFSRDAIAFVDHIQGKKVVLIDGVRLTELMVAHNIGVNVVESIELKEISNDFFDDDDDV